MSTANVLRYSALGLGLFFGFRNDIALRCSAHEKAEKVKYENELKLVDEARAQYKKLHGPKEISSSGNIEVNLDDPNLDYEKVIMSSIASLKST